MIINIKLDSDEILEAIRKHIASKLNRKESNTALECISWDVYHDEHSTKYKVGGCDIRICINERASTNG
jgi:hypothetical protein